MNENLILNLNCDSASGFFVYILVEETINRRYPWMGNTDVFALGLG